MTWKDIQVGDNFYVVSPSNEVYIDTLKDELKTKDCGIIVTGAIHTYVMLTDSKAVGGYYANPNIKLLKYSISTSKEKTYIEKIKCFLPLDVMYYEESTNRN